MFGKKKKPSAPQQKIQSTNQPATQEAPTTLPDLPPMALPTTHEMQPSQMEADKHELPSFPDSPQEKGFSQTAIKDAVSPDLPAHPKAIEMEEWAPANHPPKETIIQPPPQKKFIAASTPKAMDDCENYIKLSDFLAGRKSLMDAEDTIEGLDELIKKLRETTMREEQELTNWEKTLESTKDKLEKVTEKLFEK